MPLLTHSWFVQRDLRSGLGLRRTVREGAGMQSAGGWNRCRDWSDEGVAGLRPPQGCKECARDCTALLPHGPTSRPTCSCDGLDRSST